VNEALNVVELGGRKFQVIANGPVKHDYWMAERVRAAGIDRVNMEPGQTAAAFVDSLLDRLLASGDSLVILGGMIAPAELDLRKWTPGTAAECTAFVEELMDPADKVLVRGLVAQVLVGFFQSGLASLTTSPIASDPKRKGRRTAEPRKPETVDA